MAARMQLPTPRNINMYVPQTMPQSNAIVDPNSLIPPYGARSNFIPRKTADFGDGGAFPEIHIKQYPLEMGRKKSKTSGALQLRIDSKGDVNYDVVVRQGQRKGKHVFTQLSEAERMDIDEESLARPNQSEAMEMIKKQQAALQKKIDGKIGGAASRPKGMSASEANKPVYVRYTPADQNNKHNSGARSRIIKVHTMQVDPMEPPKFKHKKLPGGPPSPPVPIMRSPPRSITQEDQKNWKIPPCVSNWKNNRGYAIPLHQRLATSGRGLTETPINDRFAALAEALYFAERSAREDVEQRTRDRKSKTEQLRKKREEDLAQIAKETQRRLSQTNDSSRTPLAYRRDVETPRMGANRREPLTPSSFDPSTPSNFRDIGTPSQAGGNNTPGMGGNTPGMGGNTPGMGGNRRGLSRQDIEARNERERLREEAKRLRKRQMGIERARNKKRPGKVSRDISEQIALGQNLNPQRGEAVFDQRLFNRDEGMRQGFAADDTYDIYDKPMSTSINPHIYRPTKDTEDIDEDDEVKKLMSTGPKFVPHRGFKDAEGEEKVARGAGPVQFEKVSSNQDEDVFSLQELERGKRIKEKEKRGLRLPDRGDKRDRDRRDRDSRDRDRDSRGEGRDRDSRREGRDRERRRRKRSRSDEPSSPRKRRKSKKKRRHRDD